MRLRQVLAAAAAAVCAPLLTACSPGTNGIAAIGFDSAGHLVAGVKVCRSDFATATLQRGTGVGSWHRTKPGHGTETWRLATDADGAWHRDPVADGPSTGSLTQDVDFRVDSSDNSWYSSVHVSLRQLAVLTPGQLLVDVDAPPDPSGAAGTVTEVIAIDALGARRCAR